MTQEEFYNLIESWLEGDLDDDLAAELQARYETDSDLRQRVEEIRQMRMVDDARRIASFKEQMQEWKKENKKLKGKDLPPIFIEAPMLLAFILGIFSLQGFSILPDNPPILSLFKPKRFPPMLNPTEIWGETKGVAPARTVPPCEKQALAELPALIKQHASPATLDSLVKNNEGNLTMASSSMDWRYHLLQAFRTKDPKRKIALYLEAEKTLERENLGESAASRPKQFFYLAALKLCLHKDKEPLARAARYFDTLSLKHGPLFERVKMSEEDFRLIRTIALAKAGRKMEAAKLHCTESPNKTITPDFRIHDKKTGIGDSKTDDAPGESMPRPSSPETGDENHRQGSESKTNADP